MTKYDIIFESLQERVNSGELTVEDAEILNDVAFEKYGDDETEYEEVTESSEEDEGVTYEEYLESMEEELFGESSNQQNEKYRQMKKDYMNKNKKNRNILYDAAINGKLPYDDAVELKHPIKRMKAAVDLKKKIIENRKDIGSKQQQTDRNMLKQTRKDVEDTRKSPYTYDNERKFRQNRQKLDLLETRYLQGKPLKKEYN